MPVNNRKFRVLIVMILLAFLVQGCFSQNNTVQDAGNMTETPNAADNTSEPTNAGQDNPTPATEESESVEEMFTNLALNKTITSNDNNFDEHSPTRGVDGNLGTRWLSPSKSDEFYIIDLGSEMKIGTVVIRWDYAYGSEYEIQVSNDQKNWKTFYHKTGGKGKTDVLTPENPENARYVRFQGVKTGPESYYSFWEMEVYQHSFQFDPALALNPIPKVPKFVNRVSGNQQVYFSWNAADFADSYKIKRAESPDGPFMTIKTGVKSLAYVDYGLTNGKTYYYMVTAENKTGQTSSRIIDMTPKADTSADSHRYYPGDYSKSGYLGMSLPGDWRPFSDDSKWNTPIPENAKVHENSKNIIAYMEALFPKIKVTNDSWAIPVHVVNSDNVRKVPIRSNNIFDAWDTDFDGYGDEFIPFPEEIWHEQTTDGHMIIIDPFKKLSWEFSRFKPLPDGDPSCTTFNIWDLTGDGQGIPYDGYRWVTRGGRGSGFPEIAGMIRPEEIEAGEIRHAMVFGFPHNRKGDNGGQSFLSPAARSDGQYIGEQYPYEGARFQLDPNLTEADFDAIGLGEPARVIARALQKYGMYLGDNSSNLSIAMQNLDANSERSRALWEERCPGVYEDMKKIPTGWFRMLDTGEPFHQPKGKEDAFRQTTDRKDTAFKITMPDETPDAPQALKAKPESFRVNLSWQAADGSVCYQVLRADKAEGPFEVVTSNLTDTKFTDTGVSNGRVYYYKVRGLNLKGEGAPSEVVGAMPDEPENPLKLKLYPVDDAYVNGGIHANLNFGTENRLHVKKSDTDLMYTRNTFLKFDLSRINKPFEKAVLKLYCYSLNNGKPVPAVVFAVDKDDWTETTITWNNQPKMGQEITRVVFDEEAKMYEIDLTEYVRQELSKDKVITIGMEDVEMANKSIMLRSKEHTGEPHTIPYLQIDYKP